jgi:uncharacterized membrane protein YbhN (UPF0104 family)
MTTTSPAPVAVGGAQRGGEAVAGRLALREAPMVLKSPVEPLGSPADGPTSGLARVNGDAAVLRGPDVGGEHAVADREARSTARTLSSAVDPDVDKPSPRESKHFVVRAGHRLGAFASRHRGPLTVVGTLLAVGVLVFVLAGRWGQFARAAADAPWWMLTAAVGLQIASVLARTESWNVCVHAAGGTVGRRRVYRAAGFGYLGNIVNGELGFAVRIASLRRSAPRESPKAVVLLTTEIPIVLTELAFATLFSFTLVAPLGLPWWTPLVALCVVLAAVAGLARLARRHSSGWWKGLAALGDARARIRVAIFVALAVSAQIARNWLMLHASGMHASVFDATAVLIAVAVLGVLPVGPGVGAGAMVLILGSTGVAGATAAGVLLTATGTLGALAYAGWALTDRCWAKRKARLRLRTPAQARRAPVLS